MAILYPTKIKKSNLGDILINILLIRELSKHTTVYLDGKPDGFSELVYDNNDNSQNIQYIKQFPFLDRKPIVRWIKYLSKFKTLSAVFDPPGHYASGNNLKSSAKIFKYIFRAQILKKFNVKTIRIGITLGPYSKSEWKYNKIMAASYSCLGARDEVNYNELVDRELKNTILIDDMSFLYESQNFKKQTLLNKGLVNYVVFSFRGSIIGSSTDENYVMSIIKSLQQIINSNKFDKSLTILFTYQVSEDLEVNKLIIAGLQHEHLNIKLVSEQLVFSDAIALYSDARYILTNRLHVALLGLLNDTPAYALTNIAEHHKLTNVYRDLHLDNLLFDVESNNSHVLNTTDELEEIMISFNDLRAEKRNKLQQQIVEITQ